MLEVGVGHGGLEWQGTLTVLGNTLLGTVAVGNALALATITLVALANALVESLEVSLVGAGDLIGRR